MLNSPLLPNAAARASKGGTPIAKPRTSGEEEQKRKRRRPASLTPEPGIEGLAAPPLEQGVAGLPQAFPNALPPLPSLAPVHTTVSQPQAIAPVEAETSDHANLSPSVGRETSRDPQEAQGFDVATADVVSRQVVLPPSLASGRSSSGAVDIASQNGAKDQENTLSPSAKHEEIKEADSRPSKEASSPESPSVRSPTSELFGGTSSQRTTPEQPALGERSADNLTPAVPSGSVAPITSLQSSASSTGGLDSGGASSIRLGPVENAGPVVTRLAQVKPTQLPAAYMASREAFSAALHVQRDSLQAQLPVIAAPTGLPARGDSPEAGVNAAPKTAAPTSLMADVPASPAERPTFETQGPDAPPLRQVATQIEGENNAGAAVSESAQSALTDVRFSTDAVSANAGPAPSLELTGKADPGQLSRADAKAAGSVMTGMLAARQNTAQDFGEKSIAPAASGEELQTSKQLSTPEPLAAPTVEPVDVPHDIAAQLDDSLAAHVRRRMAPRQAEVEQGDARFHADLSNRRMAAHAEIASANESARQEQLAIRGEAQAEVAAHRSEWRDEIGSVEKTYCEGAATESANCRQRISDEQVSAQSQVVTILSAAEVEAAIARSEADKRAAEEKRQAEEKSGGFIGWAKQAAKAFIDELKTTLNALYDTARAAVKRSFEAAKQKVSKAFDSAREVVVRHIESFGKKLKSFVSDALSAYPELAKRFEARIDAAIDLAVRAVNSTAKVLEGIASLILTGLAETIDNLLKLHQSIYSGALTLIGMLVTGEITAILEGLGNLARTFTQLEWVDFEAAAYEAVIGVDLSWPLETEEEFRIAEELHLKRGPVAAARADHPPVESGREEEEDSSAEIPGPLENVGLDQTAGDEQLPDELSDELLTTVGDGGSVEITSPETSSDDAHDAVADSKAPVEENERQRPPDDGYSTVDRGRVKWEMMKQRIAQWWSENRLGVAVVATGALAAVGAAAFLTGGAIFAAVPLLTTALAIFFAGVAIVTASSPLIEYVEKAWSAKNADEQPEVLKPAARSLAKFFAILAVELIGYLTGKATAVISRGAKAATRTAAAGVRRGASAAARAGRIAKRAGKYVVRRGKVLLRGVSRGFSRQFRKPADMLRSLHKRLRFSRIRIRRLARQWFLEGLFSRWIKLAEGKIDINKGNIKPDIEIHGTPPETATRPDSEWIKDQAPKTTQAPRTAKGSGAAPKRKFLTVDEFENLPQSGTIDPMQLRFSQASAGSHFADGGSIEELIEGLRSRAIDPATIPPIRIVEKAGKIFTLDNRRLKAFQEAGVPIKYKKLNSIPKRERFKFTTKNDGIDIKMRRAKNE